jgi:ACS family glucarate transporter-like MFS transporter
VKDNSDADAVRSTRPTRVHYVVLAALCVITTINYVQRNSFGGAQKQIRTELHFSLDDAGDADSDFFLAYALCQIPSGWLAQRWGGRIALTVFAASWSVALGLSALANSLTTLEDLRWALGALQAGVLPCCTMILATWYPTSRRGIAMAILNSFMLLGGVSASVLTGLLLAPLGWKILFVLYAVPGVVWASWFVVWFRNRPQDHTAVNEAELALLDAAPPSAKSSAEARPAIPWRQIALSSALWLLCIQQACRAATQRLFDQWLPTYLQEARGQRLGQANLLTSLPLLGGMVGGLVGGGLSDYVLRRTSSRRASRQGVALVSLLLSLLCYVVAYLTLNVEAAVLIASLGVFAMCCSSPCAFALTMDMGGRNLGIIFGAMNMAGGLGAWAFVRFLPRVATAYSWNAALLVFAALHTLAILCWLRLNPNGVIGERAEGK